MAISPRPQSLDLGRRYESRLLRLVLFSAARAGPALATLVLALVFSRTDRSGEYLVFSLGFATASFVQSLMGGWWSHWLVRTDPDQVFDRRAVAGFQQFMFLSVLVLAGLAGASVMTFLRLEAGSVVAGALAVGLCSFQMLAGSITVARQQFRFEHRRLAAGEGARSVGGLLGALFGVWVAGTGVGGLLGLAVGGSLCVIPFTISALPGRGRVSSRAERSVSAVLPIGRAAVSYGLPIVWVVISFLVLQFSDRFMLKHFRGANEAGVYAAAYDLVNRPLGLVLAAISLASQRAIFKSYDDAQLSEARRAMRTDLVAQTVAAIGIGTLVCVACLNVPALRDVLVADLPLAVPILAFGAALILGMSHTLMRPLQAAHRTGAVGKFAMICASVNVVLNWILIPGLEALGAALATILAASLFVAGLGLMAQSVESDQD